MSMQQSLFETEPPQWEIDEAASALVATVVLPGPPGGEFDYLVPAEMTAASRPERTLEPGKRVRVPLGRGNRSVVGYCVDIATKPTGSRKLKSVTAVLDRQPLITASMLRITRWMAEYYLCPWGQVLEAVVPAGVRRDAGGREVTLLSAAPEALAHAEQLKLSTKQAEVLRLLAASDRPLTAKELATTAGCTVAPINQLRKKGLMIATTERFGAIRHAAADHAKQLALELNPDQVNALDVIRDALHSAKHETILIHGVTGSGKTEV